MRRYHIMLGTTRTTITMDSIVSELLSIHLGHAPYDAEAHAAVRAWCQGELDEFPDPGRIHVSQWLLARAVEAMARPSLVEKHGAWADSITSNELSRLRLGKTRSKPAKRSKS